MAKFTFNMPDIGEGIAEAEIVQWHKQVGDTVSEDEEFVDMMTDKATVPMESPVNGKIPHRPHLRQRFSPAPRCASARRNWASIWVR